MGLMVGCDSFVLNFTYEGLPPVVLEAMALGLLLVVVTVVGYLKRCTIVLFAKVKEVGNFGAGEETKTILREMIFDHFTT